MKNWIKVLSGIFVLAVGVVVAGVAVLKSLDFNEYRGLIALLGLVITAGNVSFDTTVKPSFSRTGLRKKASPWMPSTPPAVARMRWRRFDMKRSSLIWGSLIPMDLPFCVNGVNGGTKPRS